MTDKEKLLGGIKLIQSACHNTDFVVEDFKDEDFYSIKKRYSSLPASRVSFMIADGYEREPAAFDFDEFGNFLGRF